MLVLIEYKVDVNVRDRDVSFFDMRINMYELYNVIIKVVNICKFFIYVY